MDINIKLKIMTLEDLEKINNEINRFKESVDEGIAEMKSNLSYYNEWGLY